MILIVTKASSPIAIPGVAGDSIRLLQIIATISAQGQGETLEINIQRGGAIVMSSVSNPLTTATLQVNAGIGLAPSLPMLTSFTVATGVQIYSATATIVNMPLVDVLWDIDVTVFASLQTGSVDRLTVLYETIHRREMRLARRRDR